MGDIHTRIEGACGRITLQRPETLNALSHPMVLQIEEALDAWATDDRVRMVLVDAEGPRAFSAGGDLQSMYETGRKQNWEFGRRFWRDEYRLNAKIFNFSKPYAALMQGFTMGGGVGISCHGSHRIVGDTSRIAMPECAIGLIPDVGGTLILARAPGRLGEYLGTTGQRMGAGDAIHAGFADYYIPEADWPALTAELEQTGDWTRIDAAARPVPDSPLADDQARIDASFAGETIWDILRALPDDGWGDGVRDRLAAQCPLSAACTVELVHRARALDRIDYALLQEYRFTSRSASEGDFIEGIRAAIIDKDGRPNWSPATLGDLTPAAVTHMLRPLGADELKL
ncbi:enoyl-CoA hydratase/isomerase family protein [Oceanomicrobium pacificus]|uniref:3-hydroxyisobutyryl-CoA hydrolase n=1 Tax=Oceanomicrobium pacificus TaxID=2692916 RepID=A0A6B0U4M0_9RHOB|nr:enoyl-CoA hydratase/isomerase family protein [Oceanomicrobium pacificus]MXU65881.1 enoyl-CoA hydratase/isomerase family protein [Oceanomicrobium pacificus]